ncbi:hypothetical protein CAOG_08013 [Capsaspora owczarzaki ATCC 30864]|uniref:Homeobox domain-containing protein n=1 Tax=Capsaspora owczarzaki (strain ATCC 30864) TaxID=595528 RepID=A0A0D2W114_CAPO3|nr:hypothetical protein CAOG_08013 [Capsaspora owczarzaki ATCC 30864]KJE97947.1 hypothetical protein CAOG_008013 [Capsaspora owczarzaki ATCC 30864]|eukprot:XP_004342614.1 hypothetical protein CAOG_08013 [Capsaspora owczarzaki ATCC 30864]
MSHISMDTSTSIHSNQNGVNLATSMLIQAASHCGLFSSCGTNDRAALSNRWREPRGYKRSLAESNETETNLAETMSTKCRIEPQSELQEAQAILDRLDNTNPWKGYIAAMAQQTGHVDLKLVRWADSNHFPWDASVCSTAARVGRLDVLQWARANGCPWDESICTIAAALGYRETLKWAQENGCPMNQPVCQAILRKGLFGNTSAPRPVSPNSYVAQQIRNNTPASNSAVSQSARALVAGSSGSSAAASVSAGEGSMLIPAGQTELGGNKTSKARSDDRSVRDSTPQLVAPERFDPDWYSKYAIDNPQCVRTAHLTKDERQNIKDGDFFIFDWEEVTRVRDGLPYHKGYTCCNGLVVYKSVHPGGLYRTVAKRPPFLIVFYSRTSPSQKPSFSQARLAAEHPMITQAFATTTTIPFESRGESDNKRFRFDDDDDEPSSPGSSSTLAPELVDNTPRRSNLRKASVAILKQWLLDHVSNPYPTDIEKDALAQATDLNVSQVNNWFINARRRILQPLLLGE